MIHSFTCKNFYSFGEEITIDFTVNNKTPKNNGYFIAPSGIRLSKIESVIGPNASGKTNLLKVLPFLKWLIVNSFNLKTEDPIFMQSFAFSSLKNEPTHLSVVFEIDKKIYNYQFIITKEKILKEELKLTTFVKEKSSTKKIFSRKWNNVKNCYEISADNFKLPKGFENILRTNASIIGSAARLNHTESQLIAKYWDNIETNVIEAGWVGDHLQPTSQLYEVFDFFSKNNILKKEAEKLLCHFNLGLKGFDIKKEKKGESLSFNVQSTYSFNLKKQHLPFQYESSGTKQLFLLLKSILVALEKGSVVVIDEFDVNLHPEMVIALYGLFVQPETNPKNAQLLMSTHSHILLSKLDKYQIILVEKDGEGISDAWRLDEVSEVRSDENHYSKYLAGAYGAIPKI